MSYTALARRYRSQSFDDVVGQQPIAQTLKNAIASDRLHHAYLFTGTRGVGKTSMARIFARALNAPDTVDGCPKPKNAHFPPKDVQQRMADAIMRGDDLNVIEIDAASNTGVDNVRDLIANANLVPTDNARFKVYIIDEVHMLSKAAFNALLKVMEEPPSHVKFILCTTETEKVLPTILSRCQRFDFRNIPLAQIAQHLREVVKREKIKADDPVLFQIARLGNGSMRDALSLLDRLTASGQDLTAALLEQMLGVPDRQLIAAVVDAIAAADVAASLQAADQLLSRGIGQDQFVLALIEHWRTLMLVKAMGESGPNIAELDEQARQQAAAQAARFDMPVIIHAIAMLENIHRSGKNSSAPRALLDAAIARLALSEKFADLAALLNAAGGAAATGRVDEKKKPLTPAAETPAPPSKPIASAPPAVRPATAPAAPVLSAPRRPVTQEERDRLLRTPIVRQVIDEFGAILVDIRQPQSALPPAPPSPDDSPSSSVLPADDPPYTDPVDD
jgi:DNA polymerase-3 subunit gamma/tau